MEIDVVRSMMDPEIYSLAIALYFFGMYLRKSKRFKNTSIPIILGVVSMIFVFLHLLVTQEIKGVQDIANAIFVTFVQGMLCASAAVYANQLFKQAQYRKEENEMDKENIEEEDTSD